MARPSTKNNTQVASMPECGLGNADLVDGRSARRIQNRERLLDGAAAVFAEIGFDAAKAEDILTRTGVSRRTFYQHFPDKHEVLVALYARATNQLLEHMVRAIGNAKSGIESISTMLDIFLAYQLKSPPLIRELGVQALRLDGPLKSTRQQLHDDVVRLLHEAWFRAEGHSLDQWMLRSWILMVESFCVHVLVETPAKNTQLARARAVLSRNMFSLFSPHTAANAAGLGRAVKL